jgi:hypothetical protein
MDDVSEQRAVGKVTLDVSFGSIGGDGVDPRVDHF